MRSTATGITWIRRVSLAFCTPLTFSLAGPQDADIRILQKLTLYIGPRRICGVCNSVAQRTRIVSPTPSCLRCRSLKKRKLPARSLLMNKAVPQKIHSLTIRLLGYPGIPRLCPPLLSDRMTRHFVIITPFYSMARILQSLSFT